MSTLIVTALPPTAQEAFVPPKNLTQCIGIICNGEIEISQELIKKIQCCGYVIGVDGGLNHCDKMNVTPNWVVGDFDSVAPAVLNKFQASVPGVALPRAKDCTDLEAAIEKAKNVDAYAQMIIWAGLGGRLDHTLGNIFVLMRYPGRLFLESEQQVLFSVNDKLGETIINHATAKTVAIFPLTGPAKDVTITTEENNQIVLPSLDKCKPHFFPFSEQCTLTVGSGEVLVMLDQRELKPLGDLPEANITMNYSLQEPLAHVYEYLTHQSHNYKTIKWYSDKESICSIQPESGTVSFQSTIGQTISLIPLFGPAEGLNSNGLKWDLGPSTVDRFDKYFVGTLNVSNSNTFELSVKVGELVCIINKNLIDMEMVGLDSSDMKLGDQDWKEGNLSQKVKTQQHSKSSFSLQGKKWIVPIVGVSIVAFAWITNRYFKGAV